MEHRGSNLKISCHEYVSLSLFRWYYTKFSYVKKRERENGTSRIKTKFTIFFDFQVEKSATENEPLLFYSCRYYVDQLNAS